MPLSEDEQRILKEIEENLFKKYEKDRTRHTEFDSKSIMVYAIPEEHTLGSFAIAWNTARSW